MTKPILPGQYPIHILGVGNMGRLVAYALQKVRSPTLALALGRRPSPPVTLMFHRPALLDNWERAGRSITYSPLVQVAAQAPPELRLEQGLAELFRVELLDNPDMAAIDIQRHPDVVAGSNSPIKHLVVATKAHATTAALAPIKHRLGRDSHILFLQNGMGVTDEVSSVVFPDPETRPTYWAGICSAGVYSTGPFSIVHAGRGPLKIGALAPLRWGASCDSIADELTTAAMLEPELLTPEEIMRAQLQKLVVNSVINPLTAVFDCENYGIVDKDRGEISRSRRLLLREARVIVTELVRATYGFCSGLGYSNATLGRMVNDVAIATASNISSMLQDVRAGRPTEIDYINGYLVAQAERLGLPCEHHKEIIERVKSIDYRVPRTFAKPLVHRASVQETEDDG